MQQCIYRERRSGNSYFMKKGFIFLICLVLFSVCNPSSAEKFVIDAERNANNHNNMGVMYMKDRYYNAAIKEFNIAIMINPDTQASAVYYSNLANVYMKIGYPALAQDVLERAIKLSPMNLAYYEDLTAAFKKQKILPLKLKYYAKDTKNPLSSIMVGLILVEEGKTQAGLTKLQEFCYLEPDLIITKGVQNYIKQKAKSSSLR